MARIKETDLFAPVKEFLEEAGYEVYTEVEADSFRRADIVAVCKPVVTIVELKTSLSLSLLEQLVEWKGKAHYIYGAVPMPKNERVNQFARKMLVKEGIGLLGMHRLFNNYWDDWDPEKDKDKIYVREEIRPKLNRNISINWDEVLTEEHKHWVDGGIKGGGYVTAYKLTIQRVKEFLESRTRKGNWFLIEDILEYCETHYATPKPSLSRALMQYEDWCEVKKENGRLWFRAKTE
ncbi:MAG: hypothetical protein H0Z35_09125 [Thermoanaerobacteraceae bacterium]|nr:hypothetical protein [Thermoanaerobacteraceae bacterium]